MRWLILFFFSGAAALVYEVVWSKYLTLLLGSTSRAQTIVLVVFMLGLALGSRLFGEKSRKLHSPLKTYGVVECLIGIYGALFGWIYHFGDFLFGFLGAGMSFSGLGLIGLKVGISVLLLLPPTLLMGGTLPLIAAWLQREQADSDRWVGRFYAINSLGAVAGAALTGFFLIRTFGMGMTVLFAALINLGVGFVAIALSGGASKSNTIPAEVKSKKVSKVSREMIWGGMGVAISGGAAMGLEVVASRGLSLLFGSSTQAFSIVLVSFILGIGMGSYVVSSPRLSIRNLIGATWGVWGGAALLLVVWVLGIEYSAGIYLKVVSGLARNEVGYVYHEVLMICFSVVVLGIPAALLGAVLPLWMRFFQKDRPHQLGEQVGALLAWNTLGCVVGAWFVGFVIMPHWGLRGALGFLSLLLILGTLLLAGIMRKWGLILMSMIALWGVIWVGFHGDEHWKQVMSAGVYRLRAQNDFTFYLRQRSQFVKLLFYEDAADATVSVEKNPKLGQGDILSLRVNGKSDASTGTDLSTQYLLGHLPMFARPESREVFVLGFGSGVTAKALLGHPVGRITVAENCEPILRAAAFFAPWNGGALGDPRVHVCNEDARTVLKLDPRQYDVLVSEPSNPWFGGNSNVFTMEFYELAASRLKPDGIMVQWFHLYEMNDRIIQMLLRAFRTVFPHVEIWEGSSGDVIFMGGRQPWYWDAASMREVFERPEVKKDLMRIGMDSPETLWTRQVASQNTAFAIVDEGEIHSEEYPILEYDAPKAFYMGTISQFLNAFDERTWQWELVPALKRESLRSLNPEMVRRMFHAFHSGNPELMGAIQAGATGSVPCLLGGLQPVRQVPPPNSDETLKKLFQAEQWISTESSRWREGVQMISDVLKACEEGKNQGARNWSTTYFAFLAAKSAVLHEDLEQAWRVTDLGLRLDPGSEQLQYLKRILQRRDPRP